MQIEEMTCAEFGRYLARYGAQMSRQAVHKSLVIPKVQRGGKPKVPVAQALSALEASGRITLDEPVPVPVAAARPDVVPDAPATGRPKTGGGTYYDEKALTERVTREIQEIKLAQLRGELVRTADVTEALTEAARRIGERLDQLAMLSGELAAASREGGEQAVREILRAQVRALREVMADDLSRSLGAEDDDGDDDDAEA